MKKIYLLLLVSFSVLTANATDYFWIGFGDNWSNDQAWSLSSGGGPASAVPGSGDDVFFDGNSADCVIDVDLSGFGGTITLDAGYSGIVSFAGLTPLTTNTFMVTDGTFDATGADVLDLGTVTVNGGTMNVGNAGSGNSNTFNSLTVSSGTFDGGSADQIYVPGIVTLSGGTLISTSGELAIESSGATISRTSGTFTHNSGLVSLTLGSQSSCTLSSGLTFFNLFIVNPATNQNRNLNIGSGTTTVNGTLSLYSTSIRTLNLTGNGTISLKGDLDLSAHSGTGSPSHGASNNITFTGTSAQSIIGAGSSGQGRLPIINISQGGGGSLSMSGFINVNANWTYSGSTTVSPGSSTVTFYGANATRTVTGGTMPFNNFISATSGTGSVTLGGALRVDGNLTINSSASLVTSNNSLTLGGDFSNASTFTPGSSTITLSGSNAQTLDFRNSGTMSIANLTCSKTSNTANINDAITITGVLSCTSGTLNLSGNVTLASTSGATAQVGSSAGTISGNAIVQRFVLGTSRKWVFLASPVTTTNGIDDNWQQQIHITGTGTGGTNCPSLTSHSNGFDATVANASSFYRYGETAQGWTSINGTTSENLTPKEGYRVFIRGARSQGCGLLTTPFSTPSNVTLSATGALLQGSQTVSATCGNGCSNSNTDGWNLVGNPYAATVDMHSVTFNNVSPSIYGFNPATGLYLTYNVNTQVGDNTIRYISSGQAFWIHATSASSPNLAFTESSKNTGQTGSNLFNKSGGSTPFLTMDMLNSSSVSMDKAYIAFIDNAGKAYEEAYDAYKLGYTTNTISTYNNNSPSTKYCINTIANVQLNARDTVYIDANLPAQNQSYTLNFAFSNMPADLNVYLVDNFINSITNINSTNSVSFSTTTAPQSVGAGRFFLVFEKSITSLPVHLTKFTAEKAGSEVLLNWSTAQEENSKVFEIERSFNNRDFVKIGEVAGKGTSVELNNYAFTDHDPNTSGINYYRLKQIDNTEYAKYSGIIAVVFGSNTANAHDVKLFPVPAKDILNVQAKQISGKISISIFDISGKLVKESETFADATGSINYTMDVNKLQQGVYFIEMKSDGTQIYKNKFVKE